MRTRRRAAETLAAADCASDFSSKVSKLVLERGLSAAKCLWKGCPNNALLGGFICAEHSIQKFRDPQGRLQEELKRLLDDLNPACRQ